MYISEMIEDSYYTSCPNKTRTDSILAATLTDLDNLSQFLA